MQIYEITRKPVKEGVLGGIADELTKAGVNYAARTGVSLAPYLDKKDGLVTIKDATGKNHTYSKSGSKWVDTATNKEVDPATAVMLDNQAKQQSTQQSTAPASTPATTAPASTPAAIAPAPTTPVAQSPEEIRKAKQAVAAKAAQDQMAGKPVTSTTPPPVAATPNFNKGISGYGKTTMNAPTGIPNIAKPAIPATTAPVAQTFKSPVKAPAKLPKSPPDMNQYFADKRAQNRAKYSPASDQIKQSKPGAPTSAEYANLEKRLQQQLAAQGAT